MDFSLPSLRYLATGFSWPSLRWLVKEDQEMKLKGDKEVDATVDKEVEVNGEEDVEAKCEKESESKARGERNQKLSTEGGSKAREERHSQVDTQLETNKVDLEEEFNKDNQEVHANKEVEGEERPKHNEGNKVYVLVQVVLVAGLLIELGKDLVKEDNKALTPTLFGESTASSMISPQPLNVAIWNRQR